LEDETDYIGGDEDPPYEFGSEAGDFGGKVFDPEPSVKLETSKKGTYVLESVT
jgi:hypothetical protein